MSNRGQRSRRHLKQLGLVLILGCLTSFVVAWSLAVTQTFRGGTYAHGTINLPEDSSFSRLDVTQWRDTGAEHRTWSAQWYRLECPGEAESVATSCSYGISIEPMLAFWNVELIPLDTTKSLTRWGALGRNIRRGHCSVTMADLCDCPNWSDRLELIPGGTEDARGWPWLSLWCEVPDYWTTQPSPRLDDGCIVLPGQTDITRPARVLPLRPIPLGLLLNTLIYATLWSILLFAPRAIRRHYRAKHHRCPTCNYDLRNLPTTTCPECGTSSTSSHPPS